MNNNNSNNNNPRSSHFGEQKVEDNSNLIMMPQTNTHNHLARSMVIVHGSSIIDNSLAQACTLKRSRSESLKKSTSDPMFVQRGAKFTYKNRKPGSTVKIVSSQSSLRSSSSSLPSIEDMCPYTFIESVLIPDHDENDDTDQPAKEEQMQPLHATEFLRPTEEQIAAYSNDAVAAVRTSDINALRKIYEEGRTLGCCNRFGESLLHVACRRSNADVVSFLLKEAGVSPRIKDDYGRTPLHDACWRGNPEYDIVELLLSEEPRLAFVKDVRGHKPFQYARREHWGGWKEFLDRKRDLILR